jgi:C1A family cysteine protease
MQRIYNLKIERDMFPETITYFNLVKSPTSVDLRSKIPIVYDQGQLGSCTANALCYIYIYLDPTYIPSRLFLYYNERKIDGDIPNDLGSTLTTGIKALKTYGVCPEIDWTYNINKFTINPPSNAYTNGLNHKVIDAMRVNQSLADLKGCLTSGFPFVMGIMVYSSFESAAVARTGIVPMPNVKTEQLLGGHAITCVGYDDTKQQFIMKNSWGTGWGDKGNFYLPYAYVTSPSLTSDIWKITKETNIYPRTPVQIANLLRINQNLKHLGK